MLASVARYGAFCFSLSAITSFGLFLFCCRGLTLDAAVRDEVEVRPAVVSAGDVAPGSITHVVFTLSNRSTHTIRVLGMKALAKVGDA